MTDHLTDFVQESEERITELNNALLTLERDPNDEEAMDSIFRIAHTLKGNCGAMGLESASDLAHAIEDLLDAVRAGELEVTPELMDAVFDGVDELETMIDEVAVDGDAETDPSATIRELRSHLAESDGATGIDPPEPGRIDEVCSRLEPPDNEDHDVYFARLAITEREGVNNGDLVVDALIDAFDLIGTDPPRERIAAGAYDGRFDAVFGTAVGEAAIVSGLEPVEEVADFEIVDASDRFEGEPEPAAAGTTDAGDDLSAEEAGDLEVDELLDEFDEFDDLDEKVEEVDDDELDVFEDMGEAGSFDDLLDEDDVAEIEAEPGEPPGEPPADHVADEEPIPEPETAASATDDAAVEAEPESAAEPATDEDVEDAGAVFDELKDEVEMVGFDQLQDELEDLEFDEFDEEEEVGMDDLLGDDVDDDSFLEDGEPSESAVDDVLVDSSQDGDDAAIDDGDDAVTADAAGDPEIEPSSEDTAETEIDASIEGTAELEPDADGAVADADAAVTDSSDDGTDADETEVDDAGFGTAVDDASVAAAGPDDADPFADDEGTVGDMAGDSLEFDDGGTDDAVGTDPEDEFESTFEDDDAFDGFSSDPEADDGFGDASGDDDAFAGVDAFDAVEGGFDSPDATPEPDRSSAESFGDDAIDADDAAATTDSDGEDGVVRIVDEPELAVPDVPVPETPDRSDDEGGDEMQSIRVDVDRIDSLLTLVEGLVTSRVRLRHAVEAGDDHRELEAELDALSDLTTDLHDTVMNIRLVPLRTVTNRLPRVVRDIARDQDKEVAFEMTGEDVELDRSILDRIGDPLIHLVRNAVDHGIEPPERRESADKPREGTVEMHADRSNDRVTITVEDDGSGLDADRLRSEAVAAGIVDEGTAAAMSDEEAYDLIFHPGLSTAEEVTDVSGRGVGMDVVERTVEDLDGTVTIDSDAGAGTTVTMRLPVTVAVDEILFVESGGEEFGVPTKAVHGIEPADAIETVDGERVLPGDDGERPVIPLADVLETPESGASDDGMVVRIRDDVREVALHCDSVRDQQEVVVKPFEGFMGGIAGLSGATVRGRGEVVNILDVTTL
jgi:two-component system chemotaxis sensor kinase CheA